MRKTQLVRCLPALLVALLGCESDPAGQVVASPDTTDSASYSGSSGGDACKSVEPSTVGQGTIKKESFGIGEPCTANAECADGACARVGAEGRCTKPCTTPNDCAGGTACWLLDSGKGYCLVTSLGPCGKEVEAGAACTPAAVSKGTKSGATGYGEACASGDDCTSALCLTEDGAGMCTTSCESSKTCPTGSCYQIEGTTKVCAPDDGPGCKIKVD